MKKTVKINNIDLCYEIIGENTCKNIVLIAGLGSQMIRWDNTFCQLLADKGFRVIRFDNRDSGCSIFNERKNFHLNHPIEEVLKDIRRENIPYSLQDMAEDVIGLLDSLKIEKTHIAGRSMGGVIAQLLSSFYPERVQTMSIIMSTSLNPSLPPADPEVMAMMTKPRTDPSVCKENYFKESLAFAEKITGNNYRLDEEQEIKMIDEELSRSQSKGGIFRQLLAMGFYEYNEEILNKITAPVLVIHGTEDPIFHPDCAQDITRSIPNSELLLIEGMGHSIPSELYAVITDAVMNNCNK
ncbi:pimeloyl-ACP methyl ester carboxylesterase [Chryseobacterium sp. H1D6B]|uniref:alpha/beta fold hydrolase n=1 Tax=Chryseobacterium sp. H1D6B TaxID=2940588 RepID=UPI0015C6F3B9|nr:alpha/beta hydrolase [Chryseobacterium sp. H1D6B]MDH6254123.1 pimeloyl-ACP methyl ester carboxylesterase [Chryseobacterium sp. H1D6B]